MVHDLLRIVRDRSIAVRAAKIDVPDLTDAQRIRRGAGNYNSMCAGCHLDPGTEGTELSRGLYPKPPDLARSTDIDPARAFWVIKHGIKATGMPAWGKSMEDSYIWDMVAFLQQLPRMSMEQYRAEVDASGGHSHGGGETYDGEEMHDGGETHDDTTCAREAAGAAQPLEAGLWSQLPALADGRIARAFQISSSAKCVPLLSPRETNGACADFTLRKASSTSLPPATFAGSAFGPMRTKSLYMTSMRSTPKPSATNFSSRGFACTNTTSASPRLPMSSDCPVPSATTRTWMPVFFSKIGSRCLNSPLYSVEVVEATVMKVACACAAGMARRVAATAIPARRRGRRRPASRRASSPSAPARPSTWAAAAMPTWCSCTTRLPRRNSSPTVSASSVSMMYNDFVLVGPKSDLAKIAGSKDIVDAYKKISAAGAPFASRGDKSGTHAAELRLWKTSR